MKKSAPVGPDIAEIVIKMQEQLNSLEKKIDALISQPPARSFEPRQHSKPFQRFDRSHHQGDDRQSGGYRERVLHKATCADCNTTCEVPFRPTGDRPVYCKECFTKRKASSPFQGNSDNKAPEREFFHSGRSDRHSEHGDSRKPAGRKRSFPKKRNKKRS
ncbi:MAG: CxxC-x17-CxxC domain-containing protein [Candidatus Omnitrophota bacterium]